MAGRTMIVLLFGLGLFHALSIWFYDATLKLELAANNDARIAERLMAVRHELARLASNEREAAVHAMSGGPFEVHWSRTSLAVEGGSAAEAAAALKNRLLGMVPDLGPSTLLVGESAPADKGSDPHVIVVSMALGDGSWANVTIVKFKGLQGTSRGLIVSTTLMAIGVVLISLLLVRWLTRPLRRFAEAARGFSGETEVQALKERGPQEVRDAARAFNEMQARIRRLIDDRTLTLAAISHDLKTPLTRLRLRLEDVGDADTRERISADIREMEQMIGDTIAFLRGESPTETVKTLDLTALLATICDELADEGARVSLVGSRHVVVAGRHLDLRRAFSNLIQNAVKYGEAATISVAERDQHIHVVIDDEGPGIPEDQLEAVFAPFFRLETSRSRATGGVGLGLTLARRILRTHGGDVMLTNRVPRGLCVTARLPRISGRKSVLQ